MEKYIFIEKEKIIKKDDNEYYYQDILVWLDDFEIPKDGWYLLEAELYSRNFYAANMTEEFDDFLDNFPKNENSIHAVLSSSIEALKPIENKEFSFSENLEMDYETALRQLSSLEEKITEIKKNIKLNH